MKYSIFEKMFHPEERYSGSVLVTASFEWEGRGRLEEMGVENSSYFWHHIPFFISFSSRFGAATQGRQKKGQLWDHSNSRKKRQLLRREAAETVGWDPPLGHFSSAAITWCLLLLRTQRFQSFHCHMFQAFPASVPGPWSGYVKQM